MESAATPSEAASFAPSLHHWARNACNVSAVLRAALRLGMFTALPIEGEGAPVPLAELAARLRATQRGTRALVEVLLSTGVLVQRWEGGRQLALARGSAALRSPSFVEATREAMSWWEPMGQLSAAVRTGASVPHDGREWDVLSHCAAMFLEQRTPPGVSAEDEALFDRCARDFLRTRILITVGELGVLERFGAGPQALPALAEATGLSPTGLRTCLEVLRRLGVLVAEGDTYRFSPAAQAVLDGRSLAYFVRTLPVTALYWEALARLDETVATGRYILDLKDPEISARFYSDNALQITGIFAAHFQLGRRAAATLRGARPLTDAAILDVGTGSGVWGAAFAQAEPSAQVTFLDQEKVLEQTRKNIERLKLSKQARFWPGNCVEVDYGTGTFDLIILPQVCNALRPEDVPPLFARAARALRPRGVLVICEYVLTDHRDGPRDSMMFGLRRFMTNEGDLYSFPEYARMLEQVGLTSARCYQLPAQELLLASRGDVPLPEALAEPPAPARGG